MELGTGARDELLKRWSPPVLHKNADRDTLRKKLSDARKERKKPPRPVQSILSWDLDHDPDEHAYLLGRFPDMKRELGVRRRRNARLRTYLAKSHGKRFEEEQARRRAARSRLVQLRRLRLVDERGQLRERARASESETDASESKTDR